jgi:hypothetical protein
MIIEMVNQQTKARVLVACLSGACTVGVGYRLPALYYGSGSWQSALSHTFACYLISYKLAITWL